MKNEKDNEMEQWLAEEWEERKAHQKEHRALLKEMGSTLNLQLTEKDQKMAYELWRVRKISQWKFAQLPEEEQKRILQEQFRKNRERRAREKAIRDN